MNDRNREWEPQYENWDEDKVTLSDTYVSTNSASRGEYGVVVQEPEFPYRGNGAIFWIDPKHIYFRYDWRLWFPVSCDNPENCTMICKRRNGTLYLCETTSIRHLPVKIYHIDGLPEELFGKHEDRTGTPSQATRAPKGFIPLETEGSPESSEDSEFVRKVICAHGGGLIAASGERMFPCALYEFNGHFLCLSFFPHAGDWLADEDFPLDDTWPCWFGENSTAISPFAAAVALRGKIMPLIPKEIPFHAVVVLDSGCSIINETEYASRWREDRVSIVRRNIVEGSGLTDLEKFLAGLKNRGSARNALAKCTPAIREALEGLPPADTNQNI